MFFLFPKQVRSRQREFLVVIFGIFVIAQLVWLAMPRVSSGFPSPRKQQAVQSHEKDSESVQTAAIAETGRLDMIDYHRREFAKTTALIGLDIVVLYLFWKYGNRGTVASRNNVRARQN